MKPQSALRRSLAPLRDGALLDLGVRHAGRPADGRRARTTSGPARRPGRPARRASWPPSPRRCAPRTPRGPAGRRRTRRRAPGGRRSRSLSDARSAAYSGRRGSRVNDAQNCRRVGHRPLASTFRILGRRACIAGHPGGVTSRAQDRWAYAGEHETRCHRTRTRSILWRPHDRLSRGGGRWRSPLCPSSVDPVRSRRWSSRSPSGSSPPRSRPASSSSRPGSSPASR